MNSWLRAPIALALATVTVTGLFVAMLQMTKMAGEVRLPSDGPRRIVFSAKSREWIDEKEKTRALPSLPVAPASESPPKPQASTAQMTDSHDPLRDMLPLEAAGAFHPSLQDMRSRMTESMVPGLAPSGLNNGFASTQEPVPLVQVRPRYPSEAARKGVEGWVRLGFTITALGSVRDVRVIDAKPPRVFEETAIRTIERWKFKPQVVDGHPVARDNVVQTLKFSLHASGPHHN